MRARSRWSSLRSGEHTTHGASTSPRQRDRRHALRRSGGSTGPGTRCDQTASHYLKLVLDGLFGPENFVNELIWKRTTAKSDHAQGATHYPRVHDVLLFYRRTQGHRLFVQPFGTYDDETIEKKYRLRDSDGRRYRLDNITGPGGAAKGNPEYEVMGVVRHWRYSRQRMAQ